MNGGNILDASTRATVNGGSNSYVGGLVGINIGAVQDSNGSGNVAVTGSGNVVGGFVAFNVGSIDPSFASGSINGGSDSIVGGGGGGGGEKKKKKKKKKPAFAGPPAMLVGGGGHPQSATRHISFSAPEGDEINPATCRAIARTLELSAGREHQHNVRLPDAAGLLLGLQQRTVRTVSERPVQSLGAVDAAIDAAADPGGRHPAAAPAGHPAAQQQPAADAHEPVTRPAMATATTAPPGQRQQQAITTATRGPQGPGRRAD